LAVDDVSGYAPVGTEETDVRHVAKVRRDGIQRLQRAQVPYSDRVVRPAGRDLVPVGTSMPSCGDRTPMGVYPFGENAIVSMPST